MRTTLLEVRCGGRTLLLAITVTVVLVIVGLLPVLLLRTTSLVGLDSTWYLRGLSNVNAPPPESPTLRYQFVLASYVFLVLSESLRLFLFYLSRQCVAASLMKKKSDKPRPACQVDK